MVRRLVLDAVWRSRQLYVFLFPLMTLFWVIAAVDQGTNWAMTASLAMSYAFGPMAMVAMMSLRELRTLPVTARDLWVATWLTSTIVIALLIAAAQSVAILGVNWVSGSTAVSSESILLTTIYCFAYAGATVPILPAFGYSMGRIETHRPRWVWVSLSIGAGGLFVGAFVAPYYFADFLPLTIRQLWWGPILAVVGCLTIGGLSLAWTPQRGGLVRGTVVRQGTPPSSPGRQRFTDQLTGIPRVAWPLATSCLLMAAVALAGFIGYWAAFESGASLKSFLQHNAVLLFDTGFQPNPGMGDMWILMALAFIGVSSPWKPFARQLKVLPVTVHQINALLLATPFGLWALVWITLLITHVLVIGDLPGTLRLDVYVCVGGLSALCQALMTRYGQRGGMWSIFLMGLMMSMAKRVSTAAAATIPVEDQFVMAGFVGLVVAAFINHRTLTRSTSSAGIFQPDSLPFGMGTPGAPR